MDLEEGFTGFSSRELMQLIFAMIDQVGGDFVVTAEKFDNEYEGKALQVEYIPQKDIYVLTLEDYDYDGDKDV